MEKENEVRKVRKTFDEWEKENLPVEKAMTRDEYIRAKRRRKLMGFLSKAGNAAKNVGNPVNIEGLRDFNAPPTFEQPRKRRKRSD